VPPGAHAVLGRSPRVSHSNAGTRGVELPVRHVSVRVPWHDGTTTAVAATVALAAQQAREGLGDRGLVLDDENPGRHGARLPAVLGVDGGFAKS
jgi:hypothetical protein